MSTENTESTVQMNAEECFCAAIACCYIPRKGINKGMVVLGAGIRLSTLASRSTLASAGAC